ncbi:hypothetical protein GUJ93_ZPchr0458g22313 [Zizania palustris]|uniref:X8 domain-containing protein n=1 Tax=Zizania palustris TaxID=103762 RepID=A0A8J5QVL2_ZIZPA|nr:hypothetical protein GUJ93_ZPchr0458g22313 [Zizania palustris]
MIGTLLSVLLSVSLVKCTDAGGVGVTYGTRGTTLPPPADVARFLAYTIFDRVRLLDADPRALQAFADTGLAVDVTVPNGDVPRLVNLTFAQRWVRTRVAPFAEATNISRILVGNEVISQANRTLLLSLVPAMQNLHTALVTASLHREIKVSSPHSLEILSASTPPSAGQFRDGYDKAIVKPLLSFLRATGAPFMVNAYPFYGLTSDTLDYALFRRNFGLYHADMTPVYDAGILTAPQEVVVGPVVSTKVTPAPEAAEGRRWCVAKPAADEVALQENIDFAHAAYAMNLYFQSNGQHAFDCDFGQTGVVTTVDPSYESCKFT